MGKGATVGIAKPSAAPKLPVPPLREDLRLHPGPPHRDGSPGSRMLDPVGDAFFDVGWLELQLLARWREHADAQSLIEDVAANTPVKATVEEVGELIEFLAMNQLLSPRS